MIQRPEAMFAGALLVVLAWLGVPPGQLAAAEGDAAEGAEVFKKCRACHDVGATAKNKVGPLLNGIMGRQAGSIDGFNYSEANKAAGAKGLVWTEEVMLEISGKPHVPHARDQEGVRRPQGGEGRRDVIAYLKTLPK